MAHFGYHGKYWYDPGKTRMGDFLLGTAAVGLAAVVLLKAKRMWTYSESSHLQFALLHLPPLVLTLLIIRRAARAVGPAPEAKSIEK